MPKTHDIINKNILGIPRLLHHHLQLLSFGRALLRRRSYRSHSWYATKYGRRATPQAQHNMHAFVMGCRLNVQQWSVIQIRLAKFSFHPHALLVCILFCSSSRLGLQVACSRSHQPCNSLLELLELFPHLLCCHFILTLLLCSEIQSLTSFRNFCLLAASSNLIMLLLRPATVLIWWSLFKQDNCVVARPRRSKKLWTGKGA